MNSRVIGFPSNPAVDQEYQGWVWDGEKWVSTAVDGGAGAGMVISETEPTDKVEGMQWLNPTTGLVLFWDDEKWLQMPGGANGADGVDGVDGLWEADGDNIYYDKANVGIGTTPSYALHVNSGDNNVAAMVETATAFSLLSFDNASTTASAPSVGSHNDDFRIATSGYERFRIYADGGVNIGNSASVEQYNQLQVTAGIAGIVIKGDGTGSYAQQSFRTDEGSWAVGMRPEFGSSLVVRSNVTGLVPMVINADGLVGIGIDTPLKAIHVQSAVDESGRTLRASYSDDYFTEIAQLGAGGTVYRQEGGTVFSWQTGLVKVMTLDVSGNLRVAGTVSGDQGPLIAKNELITTLATLRNATKDETTLEGLRDSIGNAIGGLIEKFEAEIAAMPAPEPEASTQEIAE
jgi:hypothetical protein